MIVLILAVGFVGLMFVAAPAGGYSTRNNQEVVGFDGQRRAFRQTSATVESDLGKTTFDITLFGTVRDVHDPWLDVEFAPEGVRLLPATSRSVKVPEGTKTAWIATDGMWHFATESVGDLTGVDGKLAGDFDSDLFAELRRKFPEKGELIDRIEKSVVGQ